MDEKEIWKTLNELNAEPIDGEDSFYILDDGNIKRVSEEIWVKQSKKSMLVNSTVLPNGFEIETIFVGYNNLFFTTTIYRNHNLVDRLWKSTLSSAEEVHLSLAGYYLTQE